MSGYENWMWPQVPKREPWEEPKDTPIEGMSEEELDICLGHMGHYALDHFPEELASENVEIVVRAQLLA